MQHTVLPLAYNLCRFKRVDRRLVVLADAHSRTCPVHLQDIRAELINKGFDVREVYFDTLRDNAGELFFSMVKFMGIYAKAGTVIICDYFLPASSCNKKKQTRLIQLWHGCGAFKRFGYDAEDDIPSGYKGNVFRNYNLVTVSGEACVRHFEAAMRCGAEGIVKPYGIICTDRYFDEDFTKQCQDKLRYHYPDSAGRKIAVWAPTFRGNAAVGSLCGEACIDSLGGEELYVIKSVHPHLVRSNDRVDTMTTAELLVVADILITDYSSVMFEYLLMDKPIVFFAPDYEEYVAKRGFYLEYDSLPGCIIKNDAPEALGEAVRKGLQTDEYSDERRIFRQKYMDGCDGHVTERIIGYVEGNMDI